MELAGSGRLMEEWAMNAFFQDLGRTVLARWKRVDFSLPEFPIIAQEALEKLPPAEHVDLREFLCEFLRNDEQPMQTDSGFGQPELVVYDHPRFYIQVLFWLDGTTAIHQHEFSGAFHVMAGSSIHAHFNFENLHPINPHFRVGDVRMKTVELLETGRTVPVFSGPEGIHSLFHLETPSVTVVVRTQNDPGTGPQFNYLPPHVAVDPDFSDALTTRRKQLLDVLEMSGDSAYPELVREMLNELDFERGFYILQHCRPHLYSLCLWNEMLDLFASRHGERASGVAASLEEAARRDEIKELRSSITAPELRFFLALLLNAPARTDFLALVKQRFSDMPPTKTVMSWVEEFVAVDEFGICILDARFPEELDVPEEEQPEVMLMAFQYFLEEGGDLPAGLSSFSASEQKMLRAAFESSSLGILLA